MNLANALANGFTTISRRLPVHRKFNQLYKHGNWLFLALGADPIVIAKMNDGTQVKVDISTRTERIAYYSGAYDSELLEILKSLLTPDSIVLDVGANIGFYSISLANALRKASGKGKVLAFEPFLGNYDRLKFNVENNRLDEYCATRAYGLSEEAGTTVITLREDFKHGSKTGNAAIKTSDKMDEGFATSPIELKRLDDVWVSEFQELGSIDLIKMDIEGHEDYCLRGGTATIAKHRPTMLMEVNKPYYVSRGVDLDDTFMPLIPAGYTIFRKVENKWRAINSFEECRKLDNVFIIPAEKLATAAYAMFQQIN